MGVNELHRIMAGRDEHKDWPPATIEKIRELAKSNVNLVKEKDERSGWTPLHYGLKYHASGAAVRAVLDPFPKAIDLVDNNGHSPLDLGIQEGSPAEAIEVLVTVCPHITKAIDDSGRTPLHVAIHYGRLSTDGIKAILDSRPQQAKVKDADLRLPLHFCLKKGASSETVLAVLEAYRKGAEMLDGNSHTPLHAGIQNGAPADSIKLLLNAYPKAAKIEFRDGKMPLYRAIENGMDFEAIEALVQVNPAAAELKNNFGRTALFLGLEKGLSQKAIKALLDAFPQAAELRDANGYTPLHWGMGYGVSPDVIMTIMDAFPEAAGMQDKDGLTPLFVGMEKGVASKSIITALTAYPPAVEMQDNLGSTPLRYGILKGAPVEVVQCMIEAWPYAAKVKDANGFTPLMIHTRMIYDEEHRDDTTTREQIDTDTNMLKMLVESYPEGGEVEDNTGLSPISFLIKLCLLSEDYVSLVADDTCYRLQLLTKGIRDGRPLKKLCTTQKPIPLQVFLSLFDQSGCLEARESSSLPEIDLNVEVIPGWTMLEVLCDIDNQEASNIIFQIVLDQRSRLTKGNKDNVFSICCHDAAKSTVSFSSVSVVSESTMRAVADRAKLSNSCDRLKRWGEEYGRFMGTYRVEKNVRPKHRSESSVVLFGTELVPGKDDGRKTEERVALKFLSDEDEFFREIKRRQYILEDSGEDGRDYVAGLRAAYTTGTSHEEELREISNVFFRTELSKDIAKFDHVLYLNNDDGSNTRMEINHLLVLDCGSGDDLSDVISHQDISGRNLHHVLHAAISICCCLQFLNEECGIIHGDVKPRNFVCLEDGTTYRAIDLDNATAIDEVLVLDGNNRSGFMPPERAQIELSRTSNPNEMQNGDSHTPCHDGDTAAELQEILENAPDKYRRFIQKELDRVRENEARSLTPISVDATIIASCQYDMWCFGVILFQLCTGQPLFRIDRCDNVIDTDELHRIAEWSEEDVMKKLKLLPQGLGWHRIKSLLVDLLQPDPAARPEAWGPLVTSLRTGSLSQNQIIRNLESITPDILTQLDKLNYPFLLHFINEDEFRKFKTGKTDRDNERDTADLQSRLDRAQTLMEWASGIVENPTGVPAKPTQNVLKMALKTVTRKKEETIYLQLLCGWTLEPIVSYKVPYQEEAQKQKAQKIAMIGAKTCATGIKLSMLWNASSSNARMFGRPFPLIPSDIIESSIGLLEGICSSAPVLFVLSNKDEVLVEDDVIVLKNFLEELEENWRMRQRLDEFGDLEGSWEDALKREVVHLHGKRPEITFVSVKQSARQGGC